MTVPLVSVCVPVYNGAPYLARCLHSIAALTYPELEIVLIDDGSTDGSLDLLRAFAATDPRAAVHHNETNLGLTGNWNRCVEIASGEWVKFVFQDDWLEPNSVTVMVEQSSADVSLVVSGRHYEFDPDVPVGLRDRLQWLLAESHAFLGEVPRVVTVDEVAAAIAHWGNWNFVGEPVAVMFRREAACEIGPFPSRFLVIADYLYWLRLAMSSGFTWVPDDLAGFLVHGSSVSGEHRDTYAVQHLEAAGFFGSLVQDDDFRPLREYLARRGSLGSYRRAVRWLTAEAYLDATRPSSDGGRLATWRAHVSDPVNAQLVAAPRVERNAWLHRYRHALRHRLLRADRHFRMLRPVEYEQRPPSVLRHYGRKVLGRVRRSVGHPSMGPTTSPYVAPGHFYSPLTDAAEIARDSARIFEVPAQLPGIDLRLRQQRELLGLLGGFYDELPFAPEPVEGLRYYYDNPAYSYTDAMVLFAMLLHTRPKRLVEVGSGFSSALLLDVNDRYLDNALDLTFVEPYPRVLRELLGDAVESVRLLEQRVQDVPLEVFGGLDSGDVLFIDSTHVVKTGSDVVHLFFNVLPSLAPGVLVHLHAVFYPFEYPRAWVDEGRSWTEQYLLRAFLQFNEEFEIVFFGSYLQYAVPEEFDRAFPSWRNNPGGNIWLRRR